MSSFTHEDKARSWKKTIKRKIVYPLSSQINRLIKRILNYMTLECPAEMRHTKIYTLFRKDKITLAWALDVVHEIDCFCLKKMILG